MSEPHGRLGGADSVKGIACLLVLVTHYAWSPWERLALLFPFWVQAAVPAFMFVTGLVGCASLERARGSARHWQLAWSLGHLVSWVLPLMVLCAAEAVCYALGGEPFPFRVDRILLDGKAGPGGYYYLVLAQLALLLPLIWRTMERHPHAGLVLWLAADVLFEFFCRRWSVGDPAYRVGAGRYLFSVACGCHAWLTRDRRMGTRAAGLSMGLGCAWLVATMYLGYEPLFVKAWRATSWAAALWSLPALRWACLRWGGTRPLSEIGRRSFSVFTVQVFFYRLVDDHVFATVGSRPVQLLVCVLTCLAAGFAFDALVGGRVSRAGRRVSAWVARADLEAVDGRLGELVYGATPVAVGFGRRDACQGIDAEGGRRP